MQDQDVDPLIGTVLAERYQIREMMSQGGFGKVYRAEHVTIGRPLAVKVMSTSEQGLDDAEWRRRFLSEARATSRIRHPNVIDIIDFGYTEGGLAFYVMELLSGEDLAHTLRHEGSLPWSRLGPMVLQICGALGAAHRLGIIHRDIKPANCFRVEVEDNPDFIKVLDFGIAKNYAPPPGVDVPKTATHTIMGTPDYMAPEFAAGVPADERSDIYALGVVMYELATGKRPFSGADFVSILFSHRYTEPTPPRSLAPGLPEAAERIILRALHKQADARQQSMRELQDEVRSSLAAQVEAPARTGPGSSPRTVLAPGTSDPRGPLGAHVSDATLAAVPAGRPPELPTMANHRPWRGLLAISVLCTLAAATMIWLGVRGPDATISDATINISKPAPVAALPVAPAKVVPVGREPVVDPAPAVVTPAAPVVVPDPTPVAAPNPVARPSDPVVPGKKPPAARPAFNAAKAQERLKQAVKAGTAACFKDHNAPPGFEFQVTVTVAADGSATASGSATSPLRRCLMNLVTPKVSLGVTTTGGEIRHTFHGA